LTYAQLVIRSLQDNRNLSTAADALRNSKINTTWINIKNEPEKLFSGFLKDKKGIKKCTIN